jgi:hypothetical protein
MIVGNKKFDMQKIKSELDELDLLLKQIEPEVEKFSLEDQQTYRLAKAFTFHSYTHVSVPGDPDPHEEHVVGDSCARLSDVLQKLSGDKIKRIHKLCSIIFYKTYGYRIQDRNKAPDMMISFSGKTIEKTLEEIKASFSVNHQFQKEYNEEIKRRKEKARAEARVRRAKEKEQPNIFLLILCALVLATIFCFILTKIYGHLYYQNYGRFPSHVNQYKIHIEIYVGIFMGLLEFPFLNKGVVKLARKIKYYFYLYRWRLTWKCFAIPSKIKYFFEDKRMYCVIFIALPYAIYISYKFLEWINY